MKRPRFIAGAVCPSCGAMDRLVLEPGSDQQRHCVACDFRDELEPARSAELKTRVTGGQATTVAKDTEGARPVRILELGSGSDKSASND